MTLFEAAKLLLFVSGYTSLSFANNKSATENCCKVEIQSGFVTATMAMKP